MKKAAALAFVIAFLLMCILPVLAMPIADGALPPMPKAYAAETGVNTAFGEEMENYLARHFAGRDALVTLNARLVQSVFGTSAEGQVILGRNGWLFYEPTLADYLGTAPLTEQELAGIATTAGLIQEYAEGMGSDFLFTVAPNKSSLYGQYMPWYTRPAGIQNDLAALADALDARGVAYCDLYALMRGRPGLYHKRDTHWNNAGARLAYDALLDELGQPHEDFTANDVVFEQNWPGDLDRLLFPVNGVLDGQVTYQPGPGALFDYQGPARVDISRVVTQSAGGQGSLLCFRDSFGNALLPFLATAYADAAFVSATPHTPDLLQPGQTLVIEIVQRNLRVLLDAAPRMPAPLRSPGQPIEKTRGGSLVATEPADGYLHVYGTVDENPAEGAQALYLAVEAEGALTWYEAFPALEVGLAGAEAGARGFSLYLPMAQLPQRDYRLLPAAVFEDRILLFDD